VRFPVFLFSVFGFLFSVKKNEPVLPSAFRGTDDFQDYLITTENVAAGFSLGAMEA
jgi:hypothetical protein